MCFMSSTIPTHSVILSDTLSGSRTGNRSSTLPIMARCLFLSDSVLHGTDPDPVSLTPTQSSLEVSSDGDIVSYCEELGHGCGTPARHNS